MFWKFNTNASSQIEALLAKENATLQEVLDSEEVINECRLQNKQLIDFLQKPEVMEELVMLITKEPSVELDERSKFKYPNVACELLTCDVPALNERLASDEVLLDKLYTFLENDPPLNPLLASYFSKVMGVLIAKKTEQNWLSYQFTCLQVLDFLKARDTFISLLLKHLGTSAIMDIMLKLMTQVEGMEMRQNILNWLDSQRIMQSIVSLLNPKIDKERHYNAAQLLCDFIRTARDTQKNSTERADPDPLLNTLESSDTVSLLLDNILGKEKSETAIVGGILVLRSLLDVYQSSMPKFNSQTMYNSNINEEASDIEQKQKIINNTTQAIRSRVKDFHNILLEPPQQEPIITTVGTLNPPLGNTRLQVLRLFATLISTNNDDILNELEINGTFNVMLDLFFQYEWNNFLHTQVENCLITVLENICISDMGEENNSANALTKHLLVNCKLIERILDAWKENDEQQAQKKGIRKGYMGHLISIVNRIAELCSTTPLGQYFKNLLPDVAKSFEEFTKTTLSETNQIQETLLGGSHPSSAEENESYGDIPFPQTSALQQQMFSQYQVQNLASYIDGYSGFNDDAFNDGDDTLQTIDHRTDMNFDLSEGDLVQQQEIFKQVCAQNINTLDDADEEVFEEKDHTFQTVIEKQDRYEAAVFSSDSDEELPSGDDNMDIDPWSSPKTAQSVHLGASAASNSLTTPLSAGPDPWSNFSSSSADLDAATAVAGEIGGSATSSSTTTSGGWADFSSVTFDTAIANFEKAAVSKVGDTTGSLGDGFGDDDFVKQHQTTTATTTADGDNDDKKEQIKEKENVKSQTETSENTEKKPNLVDRIAQTEIKKSNIVGDIVDKEHAAGDIGNKPPISLPVDDGMKKDVSDVVITEPSKSIEGDNVVVLQPQQPSTEQVISVDNKNTTESSKKV